MFCCNTPDAETVSDTLVVAEPTLTSPRREDDSAATEAAERAEKAGQDEEDLRRKEEEEDAAAKAVQAREQSEVDEAAAKDAAAKEAADAAAAAAAAPEEPAAAVAGLPLTFRDPDGLKTYTVTFETKPLCMNFNQNAKPVKITQAFGTAKNLGVSVGSELVDIGGTNVETMGFLEMLEVLKEKIAPLTPAGLNIVFRDGDVQRTVVFPTKPLGMDFDQGKRPIRIKRVDGVAATLGVQALWELMSIDGTDVEQMEFDEMLELLRTKVGSLPMKD